MTDADDTDDWNDPPGVGDLDLDAHADTDGAGEAEPTADGGQPHPHPRRPSTTPTAPAVGLVGAFWLMGHTIALLLAGQTWAALVGSCALAAYIIAWQHVRPADGWPPTASQPGGDE